MGDDYESQESENLAAPGNGGNLAGIFENINTVPLPMPVKPVVAAPPADQTLTSGLPPWLQATPNTQYPKVVENTHQPGTQASDIPGVYYPKPINAPAAPTPIINPIVTKPTMPIEPPTPPIPISPPPPKIVTKEPLPLPPTIAGGNIIMQTDARSWLIPFISGFYIFTGVIYALGCGLILTLLFKYNQTVIETNGINLYFLKANPWTGLLPAILMLAAIIYWWVGSYLKSGSRTAWTLGVLAGIGIPVFVCLIGSIIWQMTGVVVVTAMKTLALPPIITGINWHLVLGGQLIFIFPALILIAGFKAFGRNTATDFPKGGVGLVTIFSLFVLICILGIGYLVANHDDGGLAQVQKSAGFKIYQLKALPAGRSQVTNYVVNKEGGMLNGRTDFVQVNFDYSPLEQTVGKETSPIILRQVDVPVDFDSQVFAASLLGGAASPASILVKNAKNDTGYTLQVPGKNGDLSVVTFTTLDNILVFLSSAKAGLNDLIMMANNLE